MGKSSPSPPAAPDPKVVTAEQTASNAETARLQAALNRVNQVGPNGSITWTQGAPGAAPGPGSGRPFADDTTLPPGIKDMLGSSGASTRAGGWVAGGEDGQPIWDDRATPDSIVSNAPAPEGAGFTSGMAPQAGQPTTLSPAGGGDQWTQTTTLSPEQQKLYDAQTQIQQSLYGLGQKNLANVSAAQSSPFTLAGNTPQAVTGIDQSRLPGLQSGVSAGNIQGSVNGVPDVRYGVDGAGSIQRDIANAGDITRSIAAAGQIGSRIADAGQIGSSIAPAGTIQTALSDFGRAKGSIDNTLGNQTGTFADAGTVQRGLADVGGAQRSLDYSGQTALAGNGDFSAERQRVEDALYGRQTARLDPQFEQQRQQYAQRLADQGIPLNSAAYNQAMDAFGRTRNDAYAGARNDAIAAGGAEQSRLFGQSLAARQQGVSEVNTQGDFANAAQQQAYGQGLSTGNFANSAQQQAYQQALGRGTFANQAQAEDFGQATARTGVSNAALGQDQGYEATKGNFANNAQGQQFGQNAAQLAAQNAAQQQLFGQNAAQLSAQNAAQQQLFGQNLSQSQLANQAQEQQFAQNAAVQAATNAAQAQQYGQNANDTGLFNSAQGQQFGQQLSAANLNNQAQSQGFGQNLSQADLANAARAQGVNEQAANAALANSGRQQSIQEQAYMRSLPVNELATLLGTAGGVAGPQFGAIPQVGVAPTDVTGAYATNAAQQQAAYNAQLQQQNSMFGSLGGLLGSGATAAATLYCFAPGTPITMADGRQVPIEQIGVGDRLSTGQVRKVIQASAQHADWHMLGNVLVTGSHAVQEAGKFVRVRDARGALPAPYSTDVLHSLGVDSHRIEINGRIFADFDETDEPYIDQRLSLARLNMQEAA